MFLTHQSQIQAYAKQNPEHLFHVLRFVQVTIQKRFDRVPGMIETILQTGTCPGLTMRQKNAIEFYWLKREEIHTVVFSGMSIEEKLLYVASLPGFGLAKAGFVLQCAIGRVGCLDTHNLKRFGLKASSFALSKNETRNAEKARDYIEFCEQKTGTAYLWNSWCQLIANKYPDSYADAEHVSRLHVDCIRCQS